MHLLNNLNVMKRIYKSINGLRPWETKEQIKENNDLSKSSGKIVAEEEQDK